MRNVILFVSVLMLGACAGKQEEAPASDTPTTGSGVVTDTTATTDGTVKPITEGEAAK